MLGHLQGQGLKTWKGTTRELRELYVQYDCDRPSSFRDLLRKQSVRQNV